MSEALLKEWRENVRACIEGEDPMSDDDYCGRCGMHFRAIEGPGNFSGERTVCVEARCGRWFAHGSRHYKSGEEHPGIAVYKI